MNKRRISDDEIYFDCARAHNYLLTRELEIMDQEISDLGVSVPMSLTRIIRKRHGLKLIKTGYDNLKVATLIILTFIGIIGNRTGVTAVKNIYRSLFFEESNNAVEISLKESPDLKLEFDIPDIFSSSYVTVHNDFMRYNYISDSKNNYLEVGIYSPSYKLILDNEAEKSEVDIQGYSATVYVKNGITKIVFELDGNIIMVESDIGEEGTLTIAKSIKF